MARQQRRWFGRWQLAQRDLRRREIRDAFAPLVDVAARRLEAARAELAAATERLDAVLLEQAIELLMVGSTGAPRLRPHRRTNVKVENLTRPEVIARFGLSDQQMSAARGFRFPTPMHRAPVGVWAVESVWSAALVEAWIADLRVLLPAFPQSSTLTAAEEISPVGDSLIEVSDAFEALGFDEARRAAAERFGFPRPFLSSAGFVCGSCGGPVRREVVRRADLCQWIERLRALDPGFARTTTAAA